MVNERRRVSKIKNYGSVHFSFFDSEIQSDDGRREYDIILYIPIGNS